MCALQRPVAPASARAGARARRRRARAPGRRDRRRARRQLGRGRPLHRDEQVDAVEQRPAQPPAVAREVGLRAPAAIALAGESARARVGGGDEHEARREDRRALPAHDRHAAVLQRLAQGLQRSSARTRTSSSRNSTPWWARLASPGAGTAPPPTRPGRPRSCGGARGTAGGRPARRRRAARRRCGCA